MTIEEAIKNLEYLIAISSHMPNPDHRDAIKLGIEALKAIQMCRELLVLNPEQYLEGETKN